MDMTEYLAVVEAREAFGVGLRTVRAWIAAGKLTPHKFPQDQRTYVKRADLAALLAEEHTGRGRPGGWRKREDGDEKADPT